VTAEPLDMTLLVVARNDLGCASFNREHVHCADLRVVSTEGTEWLAAVANGHLATSRTVFGFAHADILLRQGALENFHHHAMAGAVCGVVGRAMEDGYVNRWCNKNPGPVGSLDGCSVWFRRDLGLRFDAALFTSYHCFVEDLCVQAHARGIPVLVPSADATHLSGNPSTEWFNHYAPYRQRLTEKWWPREVWTT
jgi:hypothetical protein